ncbi:MAG TPA: hypothetical protein VJB14_00600 [Planctomycetota bacterium]|nr:hypothetical protein [Planctomycetota bacterium]
MALPRSIPRILTGWALIGGLVGAGIRWAGASLWIAVAAGALVGFLASTLLEGRRCTSVGPHGPDPRG